MDLKLSTSVSLPSPFPFFFSLLFTLLLTPVYPITSLELSSGYTVCRLHENLRLRRPSTCSHLRLLICHLRRIVLLEHTKLLSDFPNVFLILFESLYDRIIS